MPSLCPGEAQPETGWMGALGRWLGWGEGGQVSVEKPNPAVFTVDKRKGLRGGPAPLTSCSGWRILAGSRDTRVRFASRAGKAQSRWRLAPLLVGDLGPFIKPHFPLTPSYPHPGRGLGAELGGRGE